MSVRAIFVSKGLPAVLEKRLLFPTAVLWRPKSGKKKPDSDDTAETTTRSSDGGPGDGIPDDKHTKTLRVNAPSTRVDAVLRSALGISRNKIEAVFYENNIRLNGEKVAKKSVCVQSGDEVDVIKGAATGGLLTVARVEVLAIEPKEENVSVKGHVLSSWKMSVPLYIKHPPTGEEFALGCGVCRNAHTL